MRGVWAQTTGDGRYQMSAGDNAPASIVSQLGGYGSVAIWTTANRMLAQRWVCPKNGTLTSMSVLVSASAGSIDVAIYDTGDTTSTVRTRLATYANGGVTMAGSSTWQTFSSNPITVQAGRHYDLGIACTDGTSAALTSTTNVMPTGAGLLPTGYLTVPGGALPKIFWQIAASFPCPATVTEANCVVSVVRVPYITALIT